MVAMHASACRAMVLCRNLDYGRLVSATEDEDTSSVYGAASAVPRGTEYR